MSGSYLGENPSVDQVLPLGANKPGAVKLSSDIPNPPELPPDNTALSIEGAMALVKMINDAMLGIDGAMEALKEYAKNGENNDIIKLLNLQGPLKLGGDAVSDEDAVTFRQLKANMNNSGSTANIHVDLSVGLVNFRTSRTVLAPHELPLDGQAVKKSDYPELWALVESGRVPTTTEAQYQSNNKNRGKFAKDTSSGSFRLPDYNGTSNGSLGRLFLSGDGKGSTRNIGDIQLDDFKSHSHQLIFDKDTKDLVQITTPFPDTQGITRGLYLPEAFSKTANKNEVVSTTHLGGTTTYSGASDETKPRNITGVFTIVAKSTRVYDNNNLVVSTSSSTAPNTGTVTKSGSLKLSYDTGGNPSHSLTIHTESIQGNSRVDTKIVTANESSNKQSTLTHRSDGYLVLDEAELDPAGSPIPWPSNTHLPQGWLKCDGSTFDLVKYPQLARLYPTGKTPDLRDQFIRAWGDKRQPLTTQGDAIRNITGGNFRGIRDVNDTNTSGAFTKSVMNNVASSNSIQELDMWTINFDASRVVPVADENRPKNVAFVYIVRAA